MTSCAGSIGARRPAPWLADGVTLTGTQLARVGVQLPDLYPEHLVLLEGAPSESEWAGCGRGAVTRATGERRWGRMNR